MTAQTKTKRTNGRERPLSPHLQVYKPQMTSMTSILHRLTGVAMAIGLFMFTWWLVSASIGAEAYAVFTGFAGSPLGLFMMFGWSLAFFYHFSNGIRHLIWDTGRLFKLESAYAAGYFVLFMTVLLTAGAWYCILTYTGVSL